MPNAAPALNFYPTPTITLTWSRLSWSTEYEIQLDMLPTFSSLALIDNTIPVNSSAFTTSELPEGVYYWRVRGKRADGTWGSWSTVESFVIDLP